MTNPTLIIRRPDDWHVHLRDTEMMQAIISSSRHFGRMLIMPNLTPPVVTCQDMLAYHRRILDAMFQSNVEFNPMMTLYLTESTTIDDLDQAKESGLVLTVKLYPAGATTNSSSGVSNFQKIIPLLEHMAKIGLPLCVHGEVVDDDIDIFDREAVFIDRVLDPIRQQVPELRIVMEHITTEDAVQYVASQENMAATITLQHLMLNRNNFLVGGIRPHYYCLPILKAMKHQQALLGAATSGNRKYFLGTDSAPHTDVNKECACGCAGCFTAPVAMQCLAQTFEDAGELDKLENFTSRFGAEFYGLPLNEDTITLERSEEPQSLVGSVLWTKGPFDDSVTVFDPARDIFWRVVE